MEPLTISPTPKEFRNPQRFLGKLYKEHALAERGAILVNVPKEYVHEEAPEIDQSQKLSWVVRQNLSRGSTLGVWKYSDVEKLQHKMTAKKFLRNVSIDERIDEATFWKTRQGVGTLDACFLDKPFFRFDEDTFKKLRRWNFSTVEDMMEEADWGERARAFYIGNTGSVTPLTVEYAHLGFVFYLHWGAPKIWTVIPAKYFRTLQNNIAEVSPITLDACPTLHTFPAVYEQEFFSRCRIPFVRYEQHAEQLLVIAYQAQHQCINTGVNVGESCNYAEKHWIPYSAHQVRCRCPGASVEYGNDMREFGLRKYYAGVDPRSIPDPTENGKWYCARHGLPREFRGPEYVMTSTALYGIDEENSEPMTNQ